MDQGLSSDHPIRQTVGNTLDTGRAAAHAEGKAALQPSRPGQPRTRCPDSGLCPRVKLSRKEEPAPSWTW